MRASLPSVAFFTCLGLVFVSSMANAQSAAPSPAPATTTTTPAPAPGTPMPDMPEVSDPMLAPVAAPPTSLHKWEEALVYIRSRSTDLRTAEIEINRAEAQWRQALAGALPSVNLNASLTHQLITKTGLDGNQTPTPDSASGNITLVQPLLATRPWYALGTAKQSEQVARLNVEDVKRQIALRVANAMVAVVTAERLAELNRVGLRNALERLELTQRKANLGASTGLDVVRARQDVEAARTSLVSGDESLRQSREALGLSLGIPNAVGVAPDVRIDGLEQAAVATCKPSSKLEERPDVASAQASVVLADRAHGDAKRQFAPTINLQSTLATTTVGSSFNNSPQTTWNIQGVLQLPIWDGGARYATLRTADVDTEKAAQRLEAVKRQATIEITQARRAVGVAEASKDVALKARDLAKETDRLVRTSFQEGRGTSLELVAAATTLRQAEITLALREFDVVKARVAAVLALSSCQY